MTLAKFEPNRTIGSKVMAKKFRKLADLCLSSTRSNYPGSEYPDFVNYPGGYPGPVPSLIHSSFVVNFLELKEFIKLMKFCKIFSKIFCPFFKIRQFMVSFIFLTNSNLISKRYFLDISRSHRNLLF